MYERTPFPSSARRGGCAINKMLLSHRSGADGVVRAAKTRRPEYFAELTTPSAPTKEASQHLITVASTPPLRGGEYCAVPIHSHLHRRPSRFARFMRPSE